MNRTHFLDRIHMRSNDGKEVMDHLAGVEDAQLATATYPLRTLARHSDNLAAGREGDRGQSARGHHGHSVGRAMVAVGVAIIGASFFVLLIFKLLD